MYSKTLVFTAACLGMLLFGIVFLSLGSVNNMLAERFGLNDNDIGTLTALLPLGILVGSLVFGPVVDRFGYRWMLVGASLIVGVALEGLALAEHHQSVQFFIFLIGFGGGILNGATNALAADVSEGERGAKLSLLGVFFGIGALTMPTALALLSRTFSLSSIVAGIGALVILPAAFCLAIRFPPPKQSTERVMSTGRLRFFGEPFFLFAALALAIQSGMEGMSNDWLTRYFRKVALVGETEIEAKAQVALVVLTGSLVAMRLILARLLKHVWSQVVLMASIALAAVGALLLTTTTAYGLSLGGVLLIGSGLAAGFPVVLGYIGDRYPQHSGTAFSTVFVLALVGNMTINKVFGRVAQNHGVDRFPATLLVLLAGSAVLLLLMFVQLSRCDRKSN